MPLTEAILENRKIAVKALRTNPHGFRQCHITLDDGQGGRCALGLIATCLGIDTDEKNYSQDDLENDRGPYGLLEEALAVNSSFIYKLNDREDLTFKQIGCILQDLWEGEDDE